MAHSQGTSVLHQKIMDSGVSDLVENSDLPRGFLYLVENRYVSPAIRRAHLEVAHTPGWAVPRVELSFLMRPVLHVL